MTPLDKKNQLSIAIIADSGFAMPTAVCLTTLKASKSETTKYDVYIIDAGLSAEDRSKISTIADEGLNIEFVSPSHGVDGLHRAAADAIASATESALYKFYLQDFLPKEERVLYLDADTLIREDLSWLATKDFEGNAAMVVADSAILYYQHSAVNQVARYFNSGFMMLNLDAFRKQDLGKKLVQTKREKCSGLLVDQDAFNLTLDGKVLYLGIRYNCLCANLKRAENKLDVSDVNKLYSTNYCSLQDVFEDAAVVHFASHDKPWRYSDVPFWEDWSEAFRKTPYNQSLIKPGSDINVSIIIPVYNIAPYLTKCLDSIVGQSLKEIEIICVDDGSDDRSSAVLDAYSAVDDRLVVIRQENRGQSTARNVGLGVAQGEYCYFMDGDDILELDAVETLHRLSKLHRLDIALFDGSTIFENDHLANLFSKFENAYHRKIGTTDTLAGSDLLHEMMELHDFKPSVCLQFFRTSFLRSHELKFVEEIVYEDNVFTLHTILTAERCQYLPRRLFNRRIRTGSTMTSPVSRKSYASSVAVAARIHDLANKITDDREIREFCFNRVDYFLTQARQNFLVLEEEDLAGLAFDPGSSESLFDRLVRSQAFDNSGSVGISPLVDTASLPTSIRQQLRIIRRTRKSGSPVKALRMVRELSPVGLAILFERVWAEALSLRRKLRNAFKRIAGFR